MCPKSDIWPKSFQTAEPNDDNIALYFFPSKISEQVFEQLVGEMIHEELAFRAIVQDAELLIFTSTELPLLYWNLESCRLMSTNNAYSTMKKWLRRTHPSSCFLRSAGRESRFKWEISALMQDSFMAPNNVSPAIELAKLFLVWWGCIELGVAGTSLTPLSREREFCPTGRFAASLQFIDASLSEIHPLYYLVH
ncbi:hypothetical protein C2S52_000578 [Perilla frutescens var. hirtella]|nr:hypothetical protein C2S52_000578 [Perilla frutescens var. hirtella]